MVVSGIEDINLPEPTYDIYDGGFPEEPRNFCNEDYPGPWNFEVAVDRHDQKSPWEYSDCLKKIYIDKNKQFALVFSVTDRPVNQNLFIRATPVFQEAQYSQELVHRCISHEHPQDPSNQDVPAHVVQHILRCDNSNTLYFGDKGAKKRLNIVVPLSDPQAGMDNVKLFFYFVCKTSCPSGMNRRPIEIIFTLEDDTGDVKGRRVICVKICSCPKRDRDKDEKKLEKSENPAPAGKRRRVERRVPSSTETADTKVFPITISIVGESNYRKVLEYGRNLMAQEIVELEGKSGADAPYRKCLGDINALLNRTSD